MDAILAREIADSYLSNYSNSDRPLSLYPDPDDENWCFVFEWNTTRYYETHDISDSIGPGSGPIVVVKSTGNVWMMSSAPGFDIQLTEYAIANNIQT